jgi:hypothetical protein
MSEINLLLIRLIEATRVLLKSFVICIRIVRYLWLKVVIMVISCIK